MKRWPCGCPRETPDGRKIAANGIPEGGRPLPDFPILNSVIYVEPNGTERFRYNQGCTKAHYDNTTD
jgi:hypothetical protein